MDITNLILKSSLCYSCLIDNVYQCYGYPIVGPNNVLIQSYVITILFISESVHMRREMCLVWRKLVQMVNPSDQSNPFDY